MNSQNITILSALPHTHLTGVEISTKIIRNGTDIGYLDWNKYYSFNYQNIYLLNPRVEITKVIVFMYILNINNFVLILIEFIKNDVLVTKCIYNTLDRTKLTKVFKRTIFSNIDSKINFYLFLGWFDHTRRNVLALFSILSTQCVQDLWFCSRLY